MCLIGERELRPAQTALDWSPMLLDTRTVRSSSELSELSGCRPGCLGAVRLVWVVSGLFGHVRTLPPLFGWCLDNVCSMSGFWVKNKRPAFELFEV